MSTTNLGTIYSMNDAHDYAGQITDAAAEASRIRNGADRQGHDWPRKLATPADYIAAHNPGSYGRGREACGALRRDYASGKYYASIGGMRSGPARLEVALNAGNCLMRFQYRNPA